MSNRVCSIRTALTLLAAALSLVPGSRAEEEEPIRILLLGDSTTEGSIPRRLQPEGPHLEQVVRLLLQAEPDMPKLKIYNSGKGGETIHRLLESGRYDRDVATMEGLDYIFIRYGLNDLRKREEFATNFPADFHALIARLRSDFPAAVLIPTTVIPYFDEAESRTINDLVRQVAEKEKLDLFDLYPLYDSEMAKGPNMLNYRRFPLDQIPEAHRSWLAPRVFDGKVEVMDNELDAVFGHLPGWYSDRHPNLAGYNVIAAATAEYLGRILPRGR